MAEKINKEIGNEKPTSRLSPGQPATFENPTPPNATANNLHAPRKGSATPRGSGRHACRAAACAAVFGGERPGRGTARAHPSCALRNSERRSETRGTTPRDQGS